MKLPTTILGCMQRTEELERLSLSVLRSMDTIPYDPDHETALSALLDDYREEMDAILKLLASDTELPAM